MSILMKALSAKRSSEKQNTATPLSNTNSVTGVHLSGASLSTPVRSQEWIKRGIKLCVGGVIVVGAVGGGVYGYRYHGQVLESIQAQLGRWFGETPVPAELVSPLPVETVGVPQAEKTAAVLIQEARNLFANQHVDESLKRFQELSDQHPGDALLHNDLAMAFMKKELYTSAEKHLSQALEINPDCAVCYGNLGYLKSLLKEPVEAETYLKKAIRLKPDEAMFHFNLAVLYEKNGDVGGGAQHYQLFLDLSVDQTTELVQKVRDRVYILTGQ